MLSQVRDSCRRARRVEVFVVVMGETGVVQLYSSRVPIDNCCCQGVGPGQVCKGAVGVAIGVGLRWGPGVGESGHGPPLVTSGWAGGETWHDVRAVVLGMLMLFPESAHSTTLHHPFAVHANVLMTTSPQPFARQHAHTILRSVPVSFLHRFARSRGDHTPTSGRLWPVPLPASRSPTSTAV